MTGRVGAATESDVRRVLGRARQVVSVMADPSLRSAVVGSTASDQAALDDRTRAALGGFDWVHAGAPDRVLLAETGRALQDLTAPSAVLAFDRIERMPAKEDARHALSVRIIGVVAARLGVSRPVSEAVLNAAIAMLAADVALVRRDAVDLGVLERTADGSAYRFVPQT